MAPGPQESAAQQLAGISLGARHAPSQAVQGGPHSFSPIPSCFLILHTFSRGKRQADGKGWVGRGCQTQTARGATRAVCLKPCSVTEWGRGRADPLILAMTPRRCCAQSCNQAARCERCHKKRLAVRCAAEATHHSVGWVNLHSQKNTGEEKGCSSMSVSLIAAPSSVAPCAAAAYEAQPEVID